MRYLRQHLCHADFGASGFTGMILDTGIRLAVGRPGFSRHNVVWRGRRDHDLSQVQPPNTVERP